ncbi:MAG: tRNA (N(6)-L-threonylcarbamoyladenosine(37)-C(2))-methylthiotransferase MtaB [Clostridium sp.]|jgi:threonylcarbamoyladenosine tRNA methylthiotransferase MtaB|uniref:tRNA (N(6)-L-threonylcarbamoyladenosine(37)-C(2))- methylthiotransferase MtaB n=1 Tax=unclassified Clostridium TaxID=2614128 RepID=UPI00015BDE0B|nr:MULTISPECIES: tRNA (N(6)-L-threonylcarbamoyladenosine(37)-C(2))-methylthiotransferase MtaB [unclassified Clostridium]EDO56469.1 tRNA methylthiotransferase YqeV [Clostridium sp. L2-50]RJX01444.1 tRNA (N(6)-L-threonylcarbamoyladenosine(37)-C(2))-methylthiotransferase MtaB [Clostridium sp. AF15-41]UEA75160.1 tRNA (N(6)-L-threonylcarbamoyladenosine(37)-C(2))-methylthiotransferase MtaB [Lachnospiraceae bacterium GAM79]UEA78349.1 tRNA (N(6)-L-threonylcarbamoyladenosine(37)-C(2))-methylthiotransfer
MLKGKTVAPLTLGCKVNQYETDGMIELLKEAGMTAVSFEEKADVYLINTCSVTNMADKKSRQMIHRAKKLNPDAVVIAAGCYVQAAKDKLMEDDRISIIIGNNKKKDIVRILEDYLQAGVTDEGMLDISAEKEYEPLTINSTLEHTRAYVKIQDGCNQFCSYCIIPYVRGRIRSRDIASIIEEVERLALTGVKEIVLTGIHISSYGKDKENEVGLADVIDAISKIESIKRIRLGSLEPSIITDEFIDRIVDNEKVCPHFHLSLQSGCNTVLKRMNRKYTCEEYFEKCEMLRKAFDRPALTTDVIVGFPGETEEEFRETVDYLTKLNLYEMHIFKFSPRQGTVAAGMKDQVAPEIKNQRSDVLLALSERNKQAYEASFRGENLDVLVEEKVRREGKDGYRGHTERYMDIFVEEECMHRICDRQTDIINHVVKIPYGVGVE